MNRFVSAALAVVLMVGMAACSEAPVEDLPSPSPSSTKTPREVPDVLGTSASDAKIALIAQGLRPVFRTQDGERWTNEKLAAYAEALSTDPSAGTSVETGTVVEITLNMTESSASEKMKAEAEAKVLETRYTFSCSTRGYGADRKTEEYHSYSAVWSAPNYADIDTCYVRIAGESPSKDTELRAEEQTIANIVSDNGGDASIPASAFANALSLCAKPPFDYPNINARSSRNTQALAQAARTLCPDAPHAALLQEASARVTIQDGTFVVGQEMEGGTYQTRPGVKDCYWARTTGSGDIIANDFIGFAPTGATVSVFEGEGFEASNCGTWTKIAE